MKKTKIITLTLLMAGLVATGCTKPEQDENAAKGIKIFANDFAGNGSKVSMDPANPAEAANWIAGEPVTLNNALYQVANNGNQGNFYIKNGQGNLIEPVNDNMVSFYPGETFGNVNGNTGNVVEVRDANDDDEYDEIVLSNLEIGLIDDNVQSMAFPMVALASAGAHVLYYNHLTAGLQLTLENNNDEEVVEVAKLIIVAQSDEPVSNLGFQGRTARWENENEGPWLPMGAIGENEDEIDVKFSSVMNFSIKNGNLTYKQLTPEETLQFCVPITIDHLTSIRVYGYDRSGNVVFQKHKAFGGDGVDVDRNRMYSLPTIGIGNAD